MGTVMAKKSGKRFSNSELIRRPIWPAPAIRPARSPRRSATARRRRISMRAQPPRHPAYAEDPFPGLISDPRQSRTVRIDRKAGAAPRGRPASGRRSDPRASRQRLALIAGACRACDAGRCKRGRIGAQRNRCDKPDSTLARTGPSSPRRRARVAARRRSVSASRFRRW